MTVYTRVDGVLSVWQSAGVDYTQAQVETAGVMEELGEQGPVLVLIEGGRND